MNLRWDTVLSRLDKSQWSAAGVTALVISVNALLGAPILQFALLLVACACWSATGALPWPKSLIPRGEAGEDEELEVESEARAVGDEVIAAPREGVSQASEELDLSVAEVPELPTSKSMSANGVSFDAVNDIIEETLVAIGEVVTEVEENTDHVRELVREAIGNLGGSFSNLKGDATEQRDLVLTMVEQMANTNVTSADGEEGSMTHFVSETNIVLQEFVSHIVTVSKESMAMVTMVDQITRQMESIHDVTQRARKLAAQTGLLALNAKIEAVHAGEHGRGFSVVADEVKLLAQESNDFNFQISELVVQAQGTIEQTRKVIAELASKDMGAAIQSKGKVDSLAAEVASMNEDMGPTVGGISATAKRLNENLSVAVRCLQFEDIVTQVLGYSEGIIRYTFDFMDELGDSLRDVDPDDNQSLS